MSKKKSKKKTEKLSLFWILTIICGAMSLLLFAGAFTGNRLLTTNVIHLGISAHFREPQPFDCYLFDVFYFCFTWGALIFVIRNVHELLQAFAALMIYLAPVAAHVLINTFGPWYADSATDAIVMYIVFAILVVPGAAIVGIQDLLKRNMVNKYFK